MVAMSETTSATKLNGKDRRSGVSVRSYNSIPGTVLRQEPKSRKVTPGAVPEIQRDPIGYAGGVNLYEYVGGRVASGLDPIGFEDIPFGGGIGWNPGTGGFQFSGERLRKFNQTQVEEALVGVGLVALAAVGGGTHSRFDSWRGGRRRPDCGGGYCIACCGTITTSRVHVINAVAKERRLRWNLVTNHLRPQFRDRTGREFSSCDFCTSCSCSAHSRVYWD